MKTVFGSPHPVNDSILLVSGNGPGARGWMFAVDGTSVEKIDTLASAGLIAVGDRLYRVLCSTDSNPPTGELLIYDERGVTRYCRVDGLDDPHGVIWDGEHLVVPCSNANSIVGIRPDGQIGWTWRAPGEGDAWHVNGVHLRDGKLCASAFGRFTSHRGWNEDPDAPTGVVFRVEDQAEIVNGLCCPHDPQFLDGGWVVCNSRQAELLHIDERTGQRLRTMQLGGWTRGLCIGATSIYVGISRQRYAEGETETSEVAVLDRTTWDVVNRIALPCREITTLSLVPRRFLRGLRTGFRCNASRALANDQEDLFRAIEGRAHAGKSYTPMNPQPPAQLHCRIAPELPDRVYAGGSIHCDVKVTNLSSVSLLTAPPNPVHLGYRWWDQQTGALVPELGNRRYPLPSPMAPGQRLGMFIDIPAPWTPGRYELSISLVQEAVTWFNDVDPASGCRAGIEVLETGSPTPADEARMQSAGAG